MVPHLYHSILTWRANTERLLCVDTLGFSNGQLYLQNMQAQKSVLLMKVVLNNEYFFQGKLKFFSQLENMNEKFGMLHMVASV